MARDWESFREFFEVTHSDSDDSDGNWWATAVPGECLNYIQRNKNSVSV